MVARNVILTGVSRSGTTLTCHLLNRLPNVVALHEPMDVLALGQQGSHAAACDLVGHFFQQTRDSIRLTRTAPTKQVGGQVPADPMADQYAASGLRPDVAGLGTMTISKSLPDDYLLVVKHPTAFTALLDSLSRRFVSFAIIRNPLSVLASWNSAAIPKHTGRAPAGERLDERLRQSLDQLADVTSRQLHLLSWFFEMYGRVGARCSVIRYEDIVQSGGKALRAITPQAQLLAEPLVSRNNNPLYSRERMRQLGEQLLASDGAYWEFYARTSVRSLLDEL